MGMFGKKQEAATDEKLNRSPPRAAEPVPVSAPPPVAKPPPVAFGIGKAVALMKSMPSDSASPPAWVKVIEKTLEAVGIEVNAILKDGDRRTEAIITEVGTLQAQLQALEQEMAQKRKKVTELQGEMEDIQSVQERFGAGVKATAPAAPAAARPVEVSHFPPSSS